MSLWCHLDRFRLRPSKFPPIRSENANIWMPGLTAKLPVLHQSDGSIRYGRQKKWVNHWSFNWVSVEKTLKVSPPSPLSCKNPPRRSWQVKALSNGGQLLIADSQPCECTVHNLKTGIRLLLLGVYCKSATVSLMLIYTKFYLFKYTFAIISLFLFRKMYFMLFSLSSPDIATFMTTNAAEICKIVIETCVNHKEVITS